MHYNTHTTTTNSNPIVVISFTYAIYYFSTYGFIKTSAFCLKPIIGHVLLGYKRLELRLQYLPEKTNALKRAHLYLVLKKLWACATVTGVGNRF